jgi:exodeoxyribonuclease V beta subunit
MHSAVVNSKTFAEKIRARYPVVMIDEFQDTDPLQFEIFQGIFNDPKSLMIMVGDPKQSIYAFRGADIYSYLQVSESLPESSKSTLNRNFRSSENLLNAFNLLFDRTDPFIEKSIRFLPAVAGREQSRLIIADDNVEEKPFKLWELKNADGTSVNKTTATDKASSAVRTRIAQILTMAEQTDGQGRPQARFEFSDGESKPVKAADIAVLTDTKAQAQQVCEKLNAAGIPAVLQHTGNIFDAEEASALFHTLNAIASPGNTRALKTALSTVLFQFDLQYIASLDDEENSNELEFWQGTLHNLLDLWLKEGFIQMFFRMLRPEKEDGAQPDLLLKKDVRSNMLSLPQGERHLTDLLHLGELIHQEALQRKLGVAGVISWLQNQITHPGNSEEFERRLESDEDAVKIMTVHKSKGLQFSIVFCPFLWSRNFKQHEPEEFFYHHSVPGGYEMRFHTGSENKTEALAQYRREQLAELLRLFYVALTRAKNYCSITWVELKDLQKTALGYLAGGYSEQELKHLFMERKIETSLENFYHWKGSPVIETTIPKTGEFVYRSSKSAPELVVPKMQHAIAGDWGLMSFSSLTAGKHAESEVVPGWDDEPEAEEPAIELELSVAPEAAPPFSDFPPGAVSGDCIHQIFEQLDFQSVAHPAWYDHLETRQMINGLLTAFGRVDGIPGTEDFKKNLKKRNYQVCSMIENVMRTPLQTPETTLRLCDIEQSSAISEMEFYFPAVEHLDFDKINALIGHISGKTGTLERGSSRTPLRGFMNGKIDLIFERHGRFYVLDWKTNNLGISYQNYNRQALEKSMFDSNYLFQASIYSLALHKYLKARLPGYDFERNFGGVFYLYVRGMDGVSDENGVYFTRPDSKAVGLLENIFTEAGYE